MADLERTQKLFPHIPLFTVLFFVLKIAQKSVEKEKITSPYISQFRYVMD